MKKKNLSEKSNPIPQPRQRQKHFCRNRGGHKKVITRKTTFISLWKELRCRVSHKCSRSTFWKTFTESFWESFPAINECKRWRATFWCHSPKEESLWSPHVPAKFWNYHRTVLKSIQLLSKYNLNQVYETPKKYARSVFCQEICDPPSSLLTSDSKSLELFM